MIDNTIHEGVINTPSYKTQDITSSPAYKVAYSMYVAVGGDPTVTFETVEDVYTALNVEYSKGNNRVIVESLSLDITDNGEYNYDNEEITGYRPVNVKVEVPQKYTDEQVENIRVEAENNGYGVGYAEGLEDGVVNQKALLETITISENGTYEREDGYKEVVVDVYQKYTDEQVEQIRQESYNAGYDAGDDIGYHNGVEMGRVLQKSALTELTVSENGTYEREDGYKKVVVEVTGSGGGGDGFDFSVIGYDSQMSEDCNDKIEEYIAYSKTLYDAWDPSKTSASGLYRNNTQLVYAPYIDTSNVTNMSNIFQYCSSLTTVPPLDTSKVTDMSNIFQSCSSLTTVPPLDTSKVTKMSRMFDSCSSLTSIPQLDTSKVTDMSNMFDSCSSLTSIPQLDTSNVTNMYYMFHQCSNLTSIPQLDTSKVTNMSRMLGNCSNLTSIPQLDTSKVTNVGYMLVSCYKLTDLGGFVNLGMQSSLGGTNTNYFIYNCSNMTHDSLINLINNLYDRASAGYSVLTLKLHANSLALLSDDEKAIATNKGWTLA